MSRDIGRIRCIDSDGGLQFTVHYGTPKVLRDSELYTEHGIYYQNHQTSDGQWVYKYLRPLAGRQTDPYLTDYRIPTDANWDGPEAKRPTATWELVNSVLGGFIRDGCSKMDLLNFQALAYAAFHRLTVPDPICELPIAIPDSIIPTTIDPDHDVILDVLLPTSVIE